MPETVLRKLGQPFYTTKENGTGLGLMVTYDIIQEHNGTIEVSSQPHRGTTFTVTLKTATSHLVDR